MYVFPYIHTLILHFPFPQPMLDASSPADSKPKKAKPQNNSKPSAQRFWIPEVGVGVGGGGGGGGGDGKGGSGVGVGGGGGGGSDQSGSGGCDVTKDETSSRMNPQQKEGEARNQREERVGTGSSLVGKEDELVEEAVDDDVDDDEVGECGMDLTVATRARKDAMEEEEGEEEEEMEEQPPMGKSDTLTKAETGKDSEAKTETETLADRENCERNNSSSQSFENEGRLQSSEVDVEEEEEEEEMLMEQIESTPNMSESLKVGDPRQLLSSSSSSSSQLRTSTSSTSLASTAPLASLPHAPPPASPPSPSSEDSNTPKDLSIKDL